MIRYLILAAFLFAQAPDPAPAQRAAEAWVKLVDAGKYGESWEQTSDAFKKVVSKETWDDALHKARGPLGAFKSRSLFLTQFLKDPPNAPAGEYYLLQYNADFENRNGATETVSVFHQSQKDWRVGGYFIK